MTENPRLPETTIPLLQLWFQAVFRASLQKYREIANLPVVSLRRAVLMVIGGLFIGGLLRSLSALAWLLLAPTDAYDIFGIAEGDVRTYLVVHGSAWLFFILIYTLLFLLILVTTHSIGTFLGGQARLEQFAYVLAAYFTPITLAQVAFQLVPILYSATGFYALLFLPFGTLLAVKSIYQTNWIVALVALIPVIGYVFGFAFVGF